jgi:hypothetical protein
MLTPRLVAALGPLLLLLLLVHPDASAQFGPGGSAPVLAEQLVAESDRFLDEIRYELGGTRQGRNLEIRGNALRGTADSYRNELRLRQADQGRTLRALEGVERALAEVQRELNRPPGTAPRAAESVRRIDRLVSELRRSYGPGPGIGIQPPIGVLPPGPGLGIDFNRISRTADAIASEARGLARRVDRELGRYPPYDGLSRDLDGLASGLDQLSSLARYQAPIGKLQAAFGPVDNQARRIDSTMQRARPSSGIVRSWDGIGRGLQEIAGQIGLGGGTIIDPNRPVIIDPPGYGQFPWPIPPGGGGGGLPPPPSASAVPLIDQAIAELDAYLVAIQPHLSVIPEGPQFHRDARELRNALVGLRQAIASSGWNPSVGGLYDQADVILRRLVDRTARVSRGQIGTNNARILRVRDLMAQARSLLRSPAY